MFSMSNPATSGRDCSWDESTWTAALAISVVPRACQSNRPHYSFKQAEFVQDFDDFEQYTLPTHLRSTAKTRLIGRALLDIVYSSYQFSSARALSEPVASQSF